MSNQFVKRSFELGCSHWLVRLVKGVFKDEIAKESIDFREQAFECLGIDAGMCNTVKFEACCRLQTSHSKRIRFDFENSAVLERSRRELAADCVQSVKGGCHAKRVVGTHFGVASKVLRKHHRPKPIDDGLKHVEKKQKEVRRKNKKKEQKNKQKQKKKNCLFRSPQSKWRHQNWSGSKSFFLRKQTKTHKH